MKSIEEREREFLQARFIRMAEIQAEIRAYIERYGKQMAQFPFEPKAQFPISSPFQSKTLSATLEESLVRLERIGDIQEVLKEPHMPELMAKAFWDVAETITMQTGQVPETEYMAKWQKYRESL